MSEKDNSKADNSNKKEEFYKRLKEELDQNTTWPTKYMYKFVVPNTPENEEKLLAHFAKDAKITKNYSRTGKYLSITIITDEKSGDDIINRYQSIENIDGLIAL